MNKPLTPGTPTPVSGQYGVVGPRGGSRGNTEVTSTRGNPLQPGERYVLRDRTKHAGGK
jgi:hypothetical protein